MACAPFFKERRMKCAEPNNLDRKSGIWGTLIERISSGTEAGPRALVDCLDAVFLDGH